MAGNTEDLSRFRAQIDAIDDEIIALLTKRRDIVHQVGKHKAQHSQTSSFIRSGREANMLRDLAAKGKDALPAGAIATIWRMIISSSLSMEQEMNIAVYAPKTNRDCYWLCREYYGSFADIARYDSSEEVIAQVASKQKSVGVLPLSEENDMEPWWLRPDDEQNDVYVFARIPFVYKKGERGPSALAIANVMPECTEDDISVLAIGTENAKEAVMAVSQKVGISLSIIAEQKGHYLAEAKDFLTPDSEALLKLQNMLGKGAKVRLLGGYAAPMEI